MTKTSSTVARQQSFPSFSLHFTAIFLRHILIFRSPPPQVWYVVHRNTQAPRKLETVLSSKPSRSVASLGVSHYTTEPLQIPHTSHCTAQFRLILIFTKLAASNGFLYVFVILSQRCRPSPKWINFADVGMRRIALRAKSQAQHPMMKLGLLVSMLGVATASTCAKADANTLMQMKGEKLPPKNRSMVKCQERHQHFGSSDELN